MQLHLPDHPDRRVSGQSDGDHPLDYRNLDESSADRDFKQNRTTVKPFQKSRVLVTSGFYRHSRHPMYAGMALIGLGTAPLLGTLAPVVLAAALFIPLTEFAFILPRKR